MAASKDIYESHQYRAAIYAAGIWRGVGVTAAIVPPNYFYQLRCAENLRVPLKSSENLRVDLRAAQ